jgi:hypothetical protein
MSTTTLGLLPCKTIGYPTRNAILEVLFFQQVEERRRGQRPERKRYYYSCSSDAYKIGHSRRRWPRRKQHAPPEPSS